MNEVRGLVSLFVNIMYNFIVKQTQNLAPQ